ncbi:receptor-type tyrosine-protein phosphatase beta-like [Ptychodera flava]|uniref:receptor-type tyrosine-protein phosphatase beta-like n=1 Tax=Ptychodera flava TaxID=63121 RepID=UPI003969FB5B
MYFSQKYRTMSTHHVLLILTVAALLCGQSSASSTGTPASPSEAATSDVMTTTDEATTDATTPVDTTPVDTTPVDTTPVDTTTDLPTTAAPTEAGSTLPPFEAPTNVTIDDYDTTTITVGWEHDHVSTSHYTINATCNAANPGSTCVDGAERVDNTESSGTVGDLTPGALYDIVVVAYTGPDDPGSASDSETQRTRPEQVTGLTKVAETTNSINISWTPPSDNVWDSYEIIVSPEDGSNSPIRVSNSSVTSYSVTGLTAGRLYNISVVVLSGSERSDESSEQMRSRPNAAVLEIDDSNVDSSSIAVTWSAVDGDLDYYAVSCSDGGTAIPAIIPKGGSLAAKCEGYSTAGSEQMITVVTVSGTTNSSDAEKTINTRPNAAVLEIDDSNIDGGSIAVTWSEVGGELDYYAVSCSDGGTANPAKVPEGGTLAAKCEGYSIAGSAQTITVVTVSGTTNSSDAEMTINTRPNAAVLEIDDSNVDGTSIAVRWSEVDGDLDYYAVSCSDGGTVNPAIVQEGGTLAAKCEGYSTPGSAQTITVVTVSGTSNSTDAEITINTRPNAAVLEIDDSNIDGGSIAVRWSEVDGELDYYAVSCSDGGTANPAKVQEGGTLQPNVKGTIQQEVHRLLQ